MKGSKNAKATRPKPPDDLDGEALLEWQNICEDLEAAGRLDKTDRAMLLVYVETWASWRANTRGVAQHGQVIRYPNKTVGESPFYKGQQKDREALLRMLTAMGLTPTTRRGGGEAVEELEI